MIGEINQDVKDCPLFDEWDGYLMCKDCPFFDEWEGCLYYE